LLDDDLRVVLAVCKVTDKSDQIQTELVAKSLVHIFESQHEVSKLFKGSIRKEVISTGDWNTLFRGNTTTMKMLSFYGNLVLSKSYLRYTMSSLLGEVIADPSNMEVPTKHTEIGSISKLRNVTQKFFEAIVDSVQQIPSEIREVCNYMKQTTDHKFPDKGSYAIGNFIFLRLICPAIVAPEVYALVDADVSSAARKALLLVAKYLQNLANGGTITGQIVLEKEANAGIIELNDFISKNKITFKNYVTVLSNIPEMGPPTNEIEISDVILYDALDFLHATIVTHMSEIQNNVANNPRQSMRNQLKDGLVEVIRNLGPRDSTANK